MTTRIQQIADKFQLSTATVKALIHEWDPSGIQQPPALESMAYMRKSDTDDGLFPRLRGELRVVWNLFQYLAEKNWYPVVYNDGDGTETIHDEDKILAAMNAIFAVDECAVGMKQIGGVKRHDIVFVLGNSAEEVISDWGYDREDKDGFNAVMEGFDAEKFA